MDLSLPFSFSLFLQVVFFLLVISSNVIEFYNGEKGECNIERHLIPRPHNVSILEFGVVCHGKTLNTDAFQNAIFYLKSFTDKGGAQLYVPSGKSLIGSFNLTSHLTVFLEKEVVILGSQDIEHWKVIDPLPSYGRGVDLPGQRYRSLIYGENLIDVVITGTNIPFQYFHNNFYISFVNKYTKLVAGDNGTIDGQGSISWDGYNSNTINYRSPHIVEFVSSKDIVISNITFLNTPAWTIHPVYFPVIRFLIFKPSYLTF